MTCGVPESMAPGLFSLDSTSHCYVSKQPESDLELTNMISAVWGAELACIRYRERDPNVLRRLAELELHDQCDFHPSENIKPVIRNVVEFKFVGEEPVSSSRKLAELFRKYLALTSGVLNYETGPIQVFFNRLQLSFLGTNKTFIK
jgi:hypothetical protein